MLIIIIITWIACAVAAFILSNSVPRLWAQEHRDIREHFKGYYGKISDNTILFVGLIANLIAMLLTGPFALLTVIENWAGLRLRIIERFVIVGILFFAALALGSCKKEPTPVKYERWGEGLIPAEEAKALHDRGIYYTPPLPPSSPIRNTNQGYYTFCKGKKVWIPQ